MERIPLLLFAAILIASIAAGIPIIIALLAGYAVFFIYALRRGFRPMAILGMSLSGISEARNILIAFALIGMLTATWRCAGTIPSIVCYAFGIVRPSWFLIAAFLINSLISFLTGTSFGSVATMGVICMTMGNALGISPALTGGAILSGIFFGDRCSPVSTSALLVADITKTGIFGNILAPYLIKLFRIKNRIAAGVGIGCSSHAGGTSKAMEIGDVEGAMSGVSIGIAGILTVVLAMFVR